MCIGLDTLPARRPFQGCEYPSSVCGKELKKTCKYASVCPEYDELTSVIRLTDLMTEDESDPYWVTNRTNGKNEELPITYALLFSDGSGNPNLKEYGQLPIPPWLRVFYGDDSGLLPSDRAKDMSYILDSNLPLCKDVEFHLKPDLDQPQIADIQVIEKYAMFGHRLRVLKAFLDSQKPRGLVGMWKDRRDSEKWHTFWAVLIIGGVSLILGFFTLIVSIAQTIASFKALNPQS
jgi:hypothetical protein